MRDGWVEFVGLTSFTLPMKTESSARDEMRRITVEETAHLKRGLDQGVIDRKAFGDLHGYLIRFRTALGELITTCFKDPPPRSIDPFGGGDIILPEARNARKKAFL